MKNIKTSLFLLFILACFSANSQSIVVTYIPGQDNCNAPPEGGTYAVVGTLNGKNQYSSNATHFIEWDGTKWIFRSFTSLSGWTTIYSNTSNTTVPPCTGWTATFGCFIPTFTGGCVNPLIATPTKTNVSCNGGSNGVANVSVSGGTTPYIYSWAPSGGTGATATGLVAGSYTCTITDAAAQVLTQTFNITQPSALVATTSQTNITCNGGSNGAANAVASGGTTPYTYAWSPSGGTNPLATVLSAGNYTCTITDSKNCSITKTFALTQPGALAATTSQTNVACNGGSTGKTSVTVSGGTTPYTYVWAPSGGTAATATGLSAGNYTCTITDGNTCSITKTFALTQPTSLLVNASANNASVCIGNSSTLTANASGGTGTIAYSWVAGPTSSVNVVSPTATTIYTVNVTDANSCASSATVNVSANSCTAASALNFDGTNDYVSIAYAETGTNITHEFWFKTSQASQGLFSVTDVNPTPGGFDRDIYLTGGNINAYVWIGGPAETITTSGTNYADGNWHHVAHVIGASVGGQKLYVDGVLKANGTVTGSSFNWNTKILLGYSNTSPSNKYFNGSMDEIRIWNVARTQCEINTYKNCEIPTTASGLMANYHFNQGFDAGSNGTVTALADLSGNGRNATLTNFALTGTTSNWVAPGGVTTGSITPANLAITVGATVSNSVICNGNSTILNGTGANTYVWTGGVSNGIAFSPTTTAGYTVTGTNTLSGCTNTAIASVTVNNCAPGAALNLDGSNDLVNLGNAITSSLSGGTKVTVEAWVKPSSLSGLGCIVGNYNTGAGTMQIMLRRNGGSFYEFWIGNGGSWYNTNSVATPTLNVWQHVAATWNGSVANIYINGVLSGSTTPALATLGNASNNPVWIGANTINENFTGDVDEIRIWDRALCKGEIQNNMNGEIPTSAIGLLANYHFNHGLATGNNSAINTLTDASGNSNTGTLTNMSLNGVTSNWSAPGAVTASVTPFLAPSITVNSGAICTGQSFTITSSGASTYTIQGGNAVVNPSSNATYSVVGSTNGCLSNIVSSSVTVNSLPTISVNSGAICTGQSFTMVPSGAITYTYSNGSSIATPIADATYSVSGTDVNGCVSSIDAVSSVTVNALPIISVNSGAICAGQSFTMVPSGASTYTYSNGSSVATPIADTTYSVSGTDAIGCMSNIDAVSSVTVNALPTILAVTNNTLLCTGETATLTVSGASTYTWSTTDNTNDVAVSPTVQTTYTVEATDANGCVNSTTITQDVSLCNGIVTLNNSTSYINVYPNPNNGLFVLEITSLSKVTVTNTLGQVVIAETFEAGKHSLDIHNKANGVYFVRVIENNKQQMIKVIKQ